MGRVEDLVVPLGQSPQEAVEVALRLRAEIELGLLDQEHEAADPRVDQPLDAGGERGAAVVLLRRLQVLDRLRRLRVRRDRHEVAAAASRREEEHRRRALAVEVQRRGRTGVEEVRPLSRRRLEADPAAVRALRDVRRVRNRGARLEQHPDRGQNGRPAARRLSDERAELLRLELDRPRGAESVDRDTVEESHAGSSTRFASTRPRSGPRARTGFSGTGSGARPRPVRAAAAAPARRGRARASAGRPTPPRSARRSSARRRTRGSGESRARERARARRARGRGGGNRLRVEVEAVEPRLRPQQSLLLVRKASHTLGVCAISS